MKTKRLPRAYAAAYANFWSIVRAYLFLSVRDLQAGEERTGLGAVQTDVDQPDARGGGGVWRRLQQRGAGDDGEEMLG